MTVPGVGALIHSSNMSNRAVGALLHTRKPCFPLWNAPKSRRFGRFSGHLAMTLISESGQNSHFGRSRRRPTFFYRVQKRRGGIPFEGLGPGRPTDLRSQPRQFGVISALRVRS
jgi:hypothetical protein